MPNAEPHRDPRKSFDLTQNFDELLQELNQKLTAVPYKSIERFRFSFDGLDFDVRRACREQNECFLLNATVGYMPFTIESDERRDAIKTIIISSWRLPTVRFGVDLSSKILAGGVFDVSSIVRPDLMFYPLTLFMQEARPFINLIGNYLSAAPQRPGLACAAAG
jgi:hypothetical protein